MRDSGVESAAVFESHSGLVSDGVMYTATWNGSKCLKSFLENWLVADQYERLSKESTSKTEKCEFVVLLGR